MSSGLLSSVTCQVSVQDELGQSLEFLLKRMGITVDSRRDDEALSTGADLRVEISLADPCGHDTSMGRCLLFTPGPVRSNTRVSSGIRRLQPPFLSSTLGPLLMEMALEQKFNTC